MAVEEITSFRDWQLGAAGEQNSFYNQFGDRRWDLISVPGGRDTLTIKLSLALLGIAFENCTFEQRETVLATREKILELSGSGDVHFGCVFVSILPKDSPRTPGFVPLIRTCQTYGEDEYFVEAQPGRVYRGWTDFLENNKLPKCDMCYPVNGFYEATFTGQVRVKFCESPSCSTLFNVLDVVSTVGKLASTGVLAAAAFFPVTMPFVAAAGVALGTTTVYSTTRTVTKLVDRSAHHESIGLNSGEAAELWLGLGTDLIGSVLVGGAAAIPRLVAEGRLAAEATNTILQVLRWASIGVNSFGVLTNISILIIKLRNGTLSLHDLNYFIMSCLFIGNLVLSPYMAERVVQTLSNHGSRIWSLLKMSVNTTFDVVKSVMTVESLTTALEIICGPMVIGFLRFVNMPSTAQVLEAVGHGLRQFRRGIVSTGTVCIDLYKLLRSHLAQVWQEVLDAFKFLRCLDLSVNGQQLFEMPQLPAVEVVASVDRVLDTVDVPDADNRLRARYQLINLATQLARNANVANEREYADVCQILMNDMVHKCEQRAVVQTAEAGHLSAEQRYELLREVVLDMRTEFKSGELAAGEAAAMPPLSPPQNEVNQQRLEHSLRLEPLYCSEEYELFAFQANSQVPLFDQFVYDATCHLFKDDTFLERCEIHMFSKPVILIQSLGKSVVFNYQRMEDSENVLGLVLLRV